MTRNAVAQSIEIIRRRIDLLGTKEPDIRQQGTDRIAIEAPGESDPQKLKDVDRPDRQADLPDGRRVAPERRTREHRRAARRHGAALHESIDGGGPRYIVVKRHVAVDGSMLTHAQQGFDQQTNTPVVEFRLNGPGAHRFGQVTTENVGHAFAIVLDNQVISAPRIIRSDHRRPGPDHRQLHRRERHPAVAAAAIPARCRRR